MIDVEKLYYQLLRLEERVENLENKQWFKTQLGEHKRILSSEYSNHLNNLLKQFAEYNPKNQMNIKKALLKGLPTDPMPMTKYMRYLNDFLGKKNIKGFSLAEYEIILRKLDLISPEDKVDIGRIDPKILALVIDIL